MSLKEDIKSFKEGIPEPLSQMIQSEKERLAESGILERCLNVGDRIPAFSLPNQDGEPIFSETLLSRGPLIIAFYRGAW